MAIKTMGFGTYKITNQKDIDLAIKTAIENHYDYIDTAFVYRNEELIGNALEKLGNPMVPIQTKIWTDHFHDSYDQLKKQIKSLKQDKIWSVLLHRPNMNNLETLEGWKGLIKAKKEGLVEKIGVSNFDKDLIEYLFLETNVMPEINQIELSLDNFRNDRVVYCKKNNISIQAWSPIRVSDKNKNTAQHSDIVKKISKETGLNSVEIALLFLANQDIEPIVKSVTPSRIKDNIDGLLNKKLDLKYMDELHSLNTYSNQASETFEIRYKAR